MAKKRVFLAMMFLVLLFYFGSVFAAGVRYTYDPAGRLIKSEYDDGSSIAYAYDNAGNILQISIGAPQPSRASGSGLNVPETPVDRATSSLDTSGFSSAPSESVRDSTSVVE
jgi:YD repeat-containing protein